MADMGTTTTTTDEKALVRLIAWLSPAFPVGSFAYSGGLERAVHDRIVTDAAELTDWLATLLDHGAWRNDAILLARAWQASSAELACLAELAEALAGSAERYHETMLLGAAFLEAAAAWGDEGDDGALPTLAYPLAVGRIARRHGVPLQPTLVAWLHALVSQAISAAIRLSVIGQRQGVTLLAEMEERIIEAAGRAAVATLDDLGSATILGEIVAMRHETQHSRLFRS